MGSNELSLILRRYKVGNPLPFRVIAQPCLGISLSQRRNAKPGQAGSKIPFPQRTSSMLRQDGGQVFAVFAAFASQFRAPEKQKNKRPSDPMARGVTTNAPKS